MNNDLREKFQDKDPVSSDELYKFFTAHWHHHNQLSWSKLYIMLALESATLAASDRLSHQNPNAACVLLFVGTLVGIILYRLILRDWEIRDEYTKKLAIVHKPFDIFMIPPSEGPLKHGQSLLLLLIALLGLTNLAAALWWKDVI